MSWEEIGKLLSVLFVGLGGGIGGKWLLDLYKEWKKNQRSDHTVQSTAARRARADAMEELTEIIDTLRTDLSKVDLKAETALRNERECERKWIRAVEYIQYVMYEANARGWQLRVFNAEGTDTHLPLYLAEDRRKTDDPTRRGPERRGRRADNASNPPNRPRDQGRDQGRVEPHGPPESSGPPETPTVNDSDDDSEMPPPLPPGPPGGDPSPPT